MHFFEKSHKNHQSLEALFFVLSSALSLNKAYMVVPTPLEDSPVFVVLL